MPEISQKESQQARGKDEATTGPEKVSGLGALLRNERENRGLSHEQLSQVTRLRRHFLEALENEEWQNLPPSVFVKGFIRSYAKALGLDEDKLLDLYKNAVPEEVAPPTPIIEPKKPRRRLALVLALCLGALAIILYLWIGRPWPEQSTVQTEKGLPAEIQEEPAKEEAQPVVQEMEQRESLKKQEKTVEAATPSVGRAEMDIPGSEPEEKEPTKYPTDEDLLTPARVESSGTPDWRVLTGIRRGTTHHFYLGILTIMTTALLRYIDLVGEYIGAACLFAFFAVILLATARYWKGRLVDGGGAQ